MNGRIFVITLLILLAAAPLLAHEGSHESVRYEELGGEPRLLPSHPFYFIKEWQRAIRRAFAFGAVREANTDLAITQERLAEIKKLAETDPEATDALQRAEERYRTHLENLRDRFTSLSETNPETAVLIKRLGEIAERHLLVFEEVEGRVESRKEEYEKTRRVLIETLNSVMEHHQDRAEELMAPFIKEPGLEKFEAVKEKLEELEALYRERNGSPPPDEDGAFACIQVYDPVCGTDGKTYPNSCFAGLAKVAVKQQGECLEKEPQKESSAPAASTTNSAGSSSPAPAPQPKTIRAAISGFAFPKEIRAHRGDTIIWTNRDSAAHNVVSETGTFKSPFLSTDSTYSFTFQDKGTFSYICEPHPWMRGTVVVE